MSVITYFITNIPLIFGGFKIIFICKINSTEDFLTFSGIVKTARVRYILNKENINNFIFIFTNYWEKNIAVYGFPFAFSLLSYQESKSQQAQERRNLGKKCKSIS